MYRQGQITLFEAHRLLDTFADAHPHLTECSLTACSEHSQRKDPAKSQVRRIADQKGLRPKGES